MADGSKQVYPPQVPMTELERRGGIKFSGKNGCVQASGEVSAAVFPTYELANNVISTWACRNELFRWAVGSKQQAVATQ